MKKHLYISLLVLATLLNMSCSENDRTKAILSKAESIGTTSIDSAYNYLVSMIPTVGNCSEEQWMRMHLALADYQNKAYIDFTSDSLMLKVKDYYMQKGNINEQVKSLYLLGCVYRDLGESPLALQYYQEAVEKCDTLSGFNDYHLLSVIYCQMSQIFHDQLLAEEELEAINRCKEVALKGKDTLMYISACELSLIPYDVKSQYDSVVVISERARRMYLEYGDTTKAANILLPEVNALIELGDYQKAMLVMDIFEKESSHFSKSHTPLPGREIYYHPKGLLYLHSDDIESAKECFYRLASTPHKEGAYKGLMLSYQKLGIADSIAKYALLFANANDSSFIGKNSETTERMAAIFRFTRSQNEAKRSAELLLDSQKEKGRIYTVLYIFVLILIAAVFTYYRFKHITNRKIECLIYELKLAKQNLTKAERELTDTTTDENIAEKENEINALKDRIAKYEQEYNKKTRLEITNSFYGTNIYRIFRKHLMPERFSCRINRNEWEELESQFALFFPSFTKDIKNRVKPLTEDQWYVCMLIYLGFKENEIQILMDIDRQRLNRIKIQTNTKLFDTQNASSLRQNLYQLPYTN